MNGNVLGTERLLKAASDGGVLLVRRETGGTDWYVSPPYTSEMLSADLLLPENVRTIAKEPRQVCSIALLAMVTAYCSESLARGLIMIG